MKKVLSVILVIAAIATVFCSCSKTVESGEYTYVVLKDNTAKITKYNGTEDVVVLDMPTSVDEYTVTVIGKEAFAGVQNITVVNFPETITKIEEKAFAGSSIKKAFMHKCANLVEIEEFAFSECHNLIQVDMPRSLTTIGEQAFYYCEKLRIAYFRGNTENIGTFVFDACPEVSIYTKSSSSNVIAYAESYDINTKITDAKAS